MGFLAWACLLAFLVTALPLFVCMPLWADATLYDLAARNVLAGGVHYRDILDTAPPGMLWLHLGVRQLFGWRSETLRFADLVVVGTIVWLLVRWLGQMGLSPTVQGWTSLALVAFYLGTSELCHCQRDTWMFLPTLLALHLRWQQVRELARPDEIRLRRLFLQAVAEGLGWGAAFWIKPYVAIPAIALVATGYGMVWRERGWNWRRIGTDSAGVLAGGLAVGALGVTWMIRSGCWPYFWEVMLVWNPEYARGSVAGHVSLAWQIGWFMTRFRPWGLIHLVALPAAAGQIIGALFARQPSGDSITGRTAARALLSAFYLGWVAQAVLLQRGFEYQFVPAYLAAITVLAGMPWPPPRWLARLVTYGTLIAVAGGVVFVAWEWDRQSLAKRPTVYGPYLIAPLAFGVLAAGALLGAWSWRFTGRTILAGFALLVATFHPVRQGARLELWPRCLREGSTAELKDRLTLYESDSSVHWVHEERVAEFLQSANLKDRELTCCHKATQALYMDLDLQPSTRYVYLGVWISVFPSKREVIRADLALSPQRYAVSDLRGAGLIGHELFEEWPDRRLALPPSFPQSQQQLFPWNEPVVFRSGPYLVHRVSEPMGPISLTRSASRLGDTELAAAGRLRPDRPLQIQR
jgi:hypothetical protein